MGFSCGDGDDFVTLLPSLSSSFFLFVLFFMCLGYLDFDSIFLFLFLIIAFGSFLFYFLLPC